MNCVVQMCIYIMYMATDKDKCVFNFPFLHVAMNQVVINFMTVIHVPHDVSMWLPDVSLRDEDSLNDRGSFNEQRVMTA